MIQGDTVITNDLGLHGRPANRFVKEAKKFASSIVVRKENREFDGKSIVKLLTAHVRCGDEISIICEGTDEQEALATLIDFLEAGAGES